MLESRREEDTRQVRKTLDLFLKYQRADGKIPRKIALDYNGLKYLGLKLKRRTPRPIYSSPIPFLYSTDNDLLFVIAFCKYAARTDDYAYTRKNLGKLKSSLTFYAAKGLLRDGLIRERGLANWMDSVFKSGFVLYTNCLFFEAVRQYEKLAAALGGDPVIGGIESSQRIREIIRRVFTLDHGDHFADCVSNSGKKQVCFDLAGNLLAIVFGIAKQGQAQKILSKIEALRRKQLLHPINSPRYPFWKINPLTRLFGIADYHNGISWSWLEALLAVAQCKAGKTANARKSLTDFSKVIVRNGHVHETYFLDGQPFDHLLWKSAVPFAWGAGIFLWAESLLRQKNS